MQRPAPLSGSIFTASRGSKPCVSEGIRGAGRMSNARMKRSCVVSASQMNPSEDISQLCAADELRASCGDIFLPMADRHIEGLYRWADLVVEALVQTGRQRRGLSEQFDSGHASGSLKSAS